MRALPALRVRPLQRLNQELTELASWPDAENYRAFWFPLGASLGAQMVQDLPVMQETWV